MDKVAKALKKLNSKERKIIKEVLIDLENGNFQKLSDIKKLRGYADIYRLRKASIRIIYRLNKDGKISVLAVERRSERTYKF